MERGMEAKPGDNVGTDGDNSNGINGNANSKEHPRLLKKAKLERNQEESESNEEVDNFEKEKYIRDSEQCLQIFPEEVWMLVTEQLDPTSLENLSNSSPFFRRILLPQRVNFLFPNVWKHLAVKYHEPHNEDDDYDFDYLDSDDDDNQFPPLRAAPATTKRRCPCGKVGKVRWYSEILKLRLVCKTWCNIIDNFYETLPNYFEIAGDSEDVFSDTCPWTISRFGEETNVGIEDHHCFLRHFENTHDTENQTRNPFLGRKCEIMVYNSSADREQILFPELFRLLEKYGHHIWYTSIEMTRTNGTIVEWYTTLRLLLEKMPNLKELQISYTNEGRAATGDVLALLENELVDVEINMSHTLNLPTLDNLRRLRTENLPTAIFKELIRRNNHLSILEVERMPTYDETDIYQLPLPNLKEMTVNIFSAVEFTKLEQTSAMWSLEKISLDFDRDNEIDVKWPRLFALLENKWGSTLTHVDLSFPSLSFDDRATILKECASYRLNLPKVKSFKVNMEDVCSLDFILPMKETLEYLEITELYDVPRLSKLYQRVRREQVIQFLGYGELMLESNIWTLFPKLKQIDLAEDEDGDGEETLTITRKEWEQERKRKLVKEKERNRNAATQTDL